LDICHRSMTQVEASRDSLKEASRPGWLDDEQVWLDMDSRNTTSHEYRAEELASNNYDDVKKATPILRRAFEHLRSGYPETS